MGAKRFLVHAAAIVMMMILFAILLLLLMPPVTVHTAPPGVAERAELSIPAAYAEFTAPTAANHCPTLFGGPSVFPELLVLLKVFHAESYRSASPHVDSILRTHASGRLIDWVEIERSTVFLTDHFNALPYRHQLGTMFHEARGHYELLLSDAQMQAVLCPKAHPENTDCITKEILRGCPNLRGLTTEQVYQRMMDVGPFMER